jgi:3-phosphoshikimate 1-carboxyvinyltransferase
MPGKISGEIFISGSKSESNRLLVLNQLYNQKIDIRNLSTSEDTSLLKDALNAQNPEIDIHHAGTAMRFLTAYFAVQENKKVILTGSNRMKERPVGILVEALNSLGADIQYSGKKGFPPIQISGKKLAGGFVELKADVSSQFITALMLIAPKLEKGLAIKLNGEIISLPYLEMTKSLLEKLEIQVEMKNREIKIFPKKDIENQSITVESDWSSASYFYSLAALSRKTGLKLNSFKSNSFQGDSALAEIYETHFGVETKFEGNTLTLTKDPDRVLNPVRVDLNSTPDLAQTIAVTCAALKIKCKLSGLKTLKIKETDRLAALKNELLKIGAVAETTDDSLEILHFTQVEKRPFIKTYDDHRMAMSFAPYCLINEIEIENPEAVRKSYPDFWNDLKTVLAD